MVILAIALLIAACGSADDDEIVGLEVIGEEFTDEEPAQDEPGTSSTSSALESTIDEQQPSDTDDTTRSEPPVGFGSEGDPAIYNGDDPNNWDPYSYVIPEGTPVAELPSGFCRTWRPWAYSLGGVDADVTTVEFSLTGARETQVFIDEIDVRVISRAAPLAGQTVRCRVGGAAAAVRGLAVDLDESPPRVLYSEQIGDDPFEDLPPAISLSEGELEVFYIEATTTTCHCTWVVDIYWTAGDQNGVYTVDDGGNPFATTSSSSAPELTQ